VPFSCTVVVSYELVWIVELCLLSPTFVRSMTSWSKGYRFHSPLSLVLNPHRSSKTWIEQLASLVFVALFDSIRSIPVFAMANESNDGEPCVPLSWFFRA